MILLVDENFSVELFIDKTPDCITNLAFLKVQLMLLKVTGLAKFSYTTSRLAPSIASNVTFCPVNKLPLITSLLSPRLALINTLSPRNRLLPCSILIVLFYISILNPLFTVSVELLVTFG